MITRLTSLAFSICVEVHVPAPLNVYRHRADLIQEFGRRNATFWVSWKVPARTALTTARLAIGKPSLRGGSNGTGTIGDEGQLLSRL